MQRLLHPRLPAHGAWPAPARPPRAGRGIAVSTVASINWSNRRNDRQPRPENVPGSFFVDNTCIDCDTCRWMAPATFSRVGNQSAVTSQPTDHEGRVAAMRALLSCPTFSIHATDRSPAELRDAQASLPAPVPGLAPPLPPPGGPNGDSSSSSSSSSSNGDAAQPAGAAAAPGVYYTGWATEKSFAGCAYLIVRPQGNILVDSPRFNPVLARRMAAMGGVRHMFLTHRDDVGDHQAWADHFGATRILHETECNARQGTDKVEIKLSGEGPWVLTTDGRVLPAADAAAAAAAAASTTAAGATHAAPAAAPDCGSGGSGPGAAEGDVTLVFTPGHTRGHVCLFYKPSQALLSGDHLCSAAGEVPGAPQERLHVFRDFCWHDFPLQLRSVAKLLQYDWLHVLPAHGRRAHLRDAAARLAAVSELLAEHGEEGAAAAAAAWAPVSASVLGSSR